jgi:hypothetical protein
VFLGNEAPEGLRKGTGDSGAKPPIFLSRGLPGANPGCWHIFTTEKELIRWTGIKLKSTGSKTDWTRGRIKNMN